VEMPDDWSKKQNRSYFVWELGKVPEVCIEIVSNREGNELGSKRNDYARIGVAYYAVFDPLKQLQNPDELNGSLLKVWMLSGRQYVELPQPFWLEQVGLGLTLWEGEFEGVQDLWLRWCDRSGNVISTGKERAQQERVRAEQAQQRADRLADRLRKLGIDPTEI
ncbi:MAG: Uma2 family endonuclease, partial [Microcoleus sp. SIO2G3]|nr:Uma2 family endonuclease [Microcoleus sp. SIO2G3]